MSTRFHQQALAEVSESIKIEKEVDAAIKAEADALLRWVQEKLQYKAKYMVYHVAWRSEGGTLTLSHEGRLVDGCCCMKVDKPHYQVVWEITIDDNTWTVTDSAQWLRAWWQHAQTTQWRGTADQHVDDDVQGR